MTFMSGVGMGAVTLLILSLLVVYRNKSAVKKITWEPFVISGGVMTLYWAIMRYLFP